MNSSLAVIFVCCTFVCVTNQTTKDTVPWMGVLLYKPDNQPKEDATHIVMIQVEVVLANARDIGAVKWRLLKEHGKALFYSGDTPWEVGLGTCLLHPEYGNGSVNTIAIIFLESGDKSYMWRPIKLIEDTEKVNRLSKIFSIEYTDENKVLEQKVNAMEYVSQSACKDFYVQEEIDMEFLWPPNPICFRVMDAKETCVNNAGMALASNSTKEWLLMGLGTYGPGCSLPARYVEILPYVKWIRDNTAGRKSYRRRYYYGAHTYPSYKQTDDDLFLKRVKDGEYTLHKKYANQTSVVEGCYYPDDNKTIIYMESDTIRTQYTYNIGIYKVYIVDTNFAKRTCVKVYVQCIARSEFTSGVDLSKPEFPQTQLHVKYVPFRIRDIPETAYRVISDHRPTLGLDSYYLQFRFSFRYDAYIEVKVYGKYNGTSYNPV